MGLSAFVGLTDFRGKPRQWQIPCSTKFKNIKARTSLKNGTYSDVSGKQGSWRRVEKHQTNKGD